MQIITLGIGPDSDIEHLVLTGLGDGSIPPPPVVPDVPGTVLAGIAIILSEGLSYALPPRIVEITVILPGGASIEVSLDGTIWQAMTLDSNKNFITSAAFIRSVAHDSFIVAKSIGKV